MLRADRLCAQRYRLYGLTVGVAAESERKAIPHRTRPHACKVSAPSWAAISFRTQNAEAKNDKNVRIRLEISHH
jgi:hypothetical protein